MKDSKILLRISGGVIGLIGPPIVLWLYYLIQYSDVGFTVFIERLWYTTLFTPMLSLAVLVNLLLFFAFIWLDKDDGSAGVLLSTLLYAFVIFGLKIFI
ncbi:MAG TPA: hypothetical protein DCX54_08615 [Flavobacteriales bacterium]|nr:hypothetical protein [Flavobacteriales bacterium]